MFAGCSWILQMNELRFSMAEVKVIRILPIYMKFSSMLTIYQISNISRSFQSRMLNICFHKTYTYDNK